MENLLSDSSHRETTDVGKLEQMFKRLVDSKTISKKQLLQKLLKMGDFTPISSDIPEEDVLMNENILEDGSGTDSSRIALEAQHHH